MYLRRDTELVNETQAPLYVGSNKLNNKLNEDGSRRSGGSRDRAGCRRRRRWLAPAHGEAARAVGHPGALRRLPGAEGALLLLVLLPGAGRRRALGTGAGRRCWWRVEMPSHAGGSRLRAVRRRRHVQLPSPSRPPPSFLMLLLILLLVVSCCLRRVVRRLG